MITWSAVLPVLLLAKFNFDVLVPPEGPVLFSIAFSDASRCGAKKKRWWNAVDWELRFGSLKVLPAGHNAGRVINNEDNETLIMTNDWSKRAANSEAERVLDDPTTSKSQNFHQYYWKSSILKHWLSKNFQKFVDLPFARELVSSGVLLIARIAREVLNLKISRSALLPSKMMLQIWFKPPPKMFQNFRAAHPHPARAHTKISVGSEIFSYVKLILK